MRMILVWCWGATIGFVSGSMAGEAVRYWVWARQHRRR